MSRIFIITTPPTRRLRPASATRRIDRVCEVPRAMPAMMSAVMMRKSSSSGGLIR